MTISLVVCTYRRPVAIDRLLTSLTGQVRAPEEILIIDASPDHETEEVVTTHVERGTARLRHIAVDESERGLTRQRNRGIREAAGDLVAFLDDDTIPADSYFAEIERCFDRHPSAVGVGGTIVDEATWRQADTQVVTSPGWYRWDGWERPEGARWRIRRAVGLATSAPPGHMPPSGHGRPVSFLPPSGDDYEVEFVMGAAQTWRRAVLDHHSFSPYFEGYGLYEDLDFCIDMPPEGPLYLCTAATLHHYHDPVSRPSKSRYGRMVVENGWYVWRRRWPSPTAVDRLRWWLTTMLLVLIRLGGVFAHHRSGAVAESSGRLLGIITTAPCEFSRQYRTRHYGPYSRLSR